MNFIIFAIFHRGEQSGKFYGLLTPFIEHTVPYLYNPVCSRAARVAPFILYLAVNEADSLKCERMLTSFSVTIPILVVNLYTLNLNLATIP